MATSPLILEEKDFTGQSFILPNFHDTYPFIDPLKQDLKGKRIFISGASKGIGRALAIAYARAGASHIAIAARSDLSVQKKEVEDAARNAPRDSTPIVLSLNVDVTDWKSVKRTAEKIEAEFGGLDILINNAGYLSEFVRIVDADPEKWWRDWEVNVKGIFFAEKAFIPLLLKGEHKTIINMSSITAQLSGGWGSAYQTSKLAVNRITEHTFAEYKEEGLIAISIHPGGGLYYQQVCEQVLMLHPVLTELASGLPKETQEYLIDTAELAADSIVYLTSERREWLGGRYVSVNWDMEKLIQQKDRIVKEDLLKVKLSI